MQWWIRKLLARLTQRVMSVVTAKVEAQLEMELAEVREELLAKAADLSGEATASLSERLTQASARLGMVELPQERLMLEAESETDLGGVAEAGGRNSSTSAKKAKSAGVASGRGRGRPRKTPEATTPSLTAESTSDTSPSLMRQSDGQ